MATAADQGEATSLPVAPQVVHISFFSKRDRNLLGEALAEETCSVASGLTPAYYQWWLDQSASQRSLFPVRLIGDASAQQLFTPISKGDLALST